MNYRRDFSLETLRNRQQTTDNGRKSASGWQSLLSLERNVAGCQEKQRRNTLTLLYPTLPLQYGVYLRKFFGGEYLVVAGAEVGFQLGGGAGSDDDRCYPCVA